MKEHADNPVDWYPWCEEAFNKAKEEDKPIFLSIGYSSCHWCHVMKRESFRDEEVAALLNETFISIKVDKEERPDIDSVYMDVARSMTGRGGWPLTILMTPDKIPFYAGTYIPKEGKGSMLGLMELIPKIDELWEKDRERLVERGKSVIENLKREDMGRDKKIDELILDEAFDYLSRAYDEEHGGFGNTQKFPSPQNFLFLLRYDEKKVGKANKMVRKTLKEMRKGGIYDHLGYGFHRYSTDREWILPHFEKMLYDQAMMLLAYTEAWQVTKERLYSETVAEIVEYIDRNLRSEKGGFYSSEDAESSGKEGAYYTWNEEEVQKILGKKSDIFVEIFNIEEGGNFRDEATNRKTGENVLYLRETPDEIVRNKDVSAEEIEGMKKKLFEQRLQREKPKVDNKILTDWNSLILTALSRAGFVFDEDRYLDMAEETASFILEEMMNDGELYHAYIDGEISVKGGLDDYSFLIWGLLNLYRATLKIEYLKKAIDLADVMFKNFWDEEDGGFFISNKDQNELPIHKKEVYDGAYPSGNSISLIDLVLLSQITGDEKYGEAVEQMIEAFSGRVSKNPGQFTMFLTALQSWWSGGEKIVLVGEREEVENFLEVLRRRFLPNRVLILKDHENKKELKDFIEFISSISKVKRKPTAYICENFSCKEPITDIEEFERMLEKS